MLTLNVSSVYLGVARVAVKLCHDLRLRPGVAGSRNRPSRTQSLAYWPYQKRPFGETAHQPPRCSGTTPGAVSQYPSRFQRLIERGHPRVL